VNEAPFENLHGKLELQQGAGRVEACVDLMPRPSGFARREAMFLGMSILFAVFDCARGDRETLEQWIRSRTAPQRRVERARIVLGSAGGMSGYELSIVMGISRPTIQRWLDRYEEFGVERLDDQPRSGRPRQVTTAIAEAVVRKTIEERPPVGTYWSTRIMAREVGLHHGQIARIWKAHGLKPHRVRTFKLSKAPRFVSPLRARS
jgi:transposase